jgi:hypothetical protein
MGECLAEVPCLVAKAEALSTNIWTLALSCLAEQHLLIKGRGMHRGAKVQGSQELFNRFLIIRSWEWGCS